MGQAQRLHTHTLLLVDNMKPVHWAMIAAAAYLYYITAQRKNVSYNPDLGPFDYGPPGTGWDGEPIPAFKYPAFPHTPTPSHAMDKVNVFTKISTYDFPDASLGGYEGGMNWPARDNIFG